MLYLPPYSPDLNPIEKIFSKVKSFFVRRRTNPSSALRRDRLRTGDDHPIRLPQCLPLLRLHSYVKNETALILQLDFTEGVLLG